VSPAPVIDLNADVGERPGPQGVAADAAILAAVSSANVACGFHAGDAETMRAVCTDAVRLHKRIGAHVSYLDREGFGRRDLDVDLTTLSGQIIQQIESLRAIAGSVGGEVGYVKPHGALYNRAAVDPLRAAVIVDALATAGGGLKLVGPAGSELLRVAVARGLEGVAEGFADRAYLPDGTLAPRSEEGTVLTGEEALEQAVKLAGSGRFRTLCIHSDTPGAADLALAVRNRLIGTGFEIRPFA
jgi:5-oxoprolinase (ATP-hydrolysing) subunit A